MSRASGRRGLALILAILVALAVVVDLIRPGSLILAGWDSLSPDPTPRERAGQTLERFGVPLPRSNWVEEPRSRGDMPEAFRGARRAG